MGTTEGGMEVGAEMLLGLAAVTLVLGVCYWLLRERDDRLGRTPRHPA
jgi:hypothetical protein